MRRALVRGLHGTATSRALPALTNDAPAAPRSLLASLLGGSRGPAPVPLSQPLPGVVEPPYTPPTSAPTASVKKLANGALLGAEETPGATLALGVYVDSGSKYETADTAGASHVLERLAFKATHHRSAFRVTREAEVIGASLVASASREQMSFTADCLRTHLPEAAELLLDCALHPKFDRVTLASCVAQLKTELAELAKNPGAVLMERLHTTAWDGGLGRPLLADAASLDALTPDALAHFVESTFTAPRLAVSGAGISLAALSSAVEPLLSSLPSVPTGSSSSSCDGVYVGGEFRDRSAHSDDGGAHLALGFAAPGGWRDVKAATALTVLQTLLGGGGSFSAGGPGKGMYSRLYTRVLNHHAWATSCTGFHSLYNDTGIVGITASCSDGKAASMVDLMCKELLAVAAPKGVKAPELERAKAATVSSVLMNLESRAVVAEDIGRQCLTYGRRMSPADFIAGVNALTPEDIASAVRALLKSPPTFVALGDVGGAPRYADIAKRFG